VLSRPTAARGCRVGQVDADVRRIPELGEDFGHVVAAPRLFRIVRR
jgi:hypothetical protein